VFIVINEISLLTGFFFTSTRLLLYANKNELELEVGTKHGEATEFLVGSSVLVRWYD
jgi:hypothetical protein